ncbi:DNA-entry nuclease [Lacticaseibacillus porcinae]|uniref:sunset domain-containing protein n=1 Tax=Lacticaseibacillus porcinae TaxID=1123687 RepID=UPI000F7ABF87|nr:DNA-entry nuclease [Lacticaseibacillus porcinae]
MNNVFTIIVIASFFAALYFGGRFGMTKVKHLPSRSFGRNGLISVGVLVISFIGLVVTAPTTNLTPAQATTKIRQAMKLDQTLDAKADAADKRYTKLSKQKRLLLAQVKKAEKAKTKAEDQRDATSSSIATAESKQAESESIAASSSSAAASSRAEEASRQAASASSQAAVQASQAAAAASQAAATRAAANTNHTAPVNNGDMTTGSVQKIVGNVNSHIYHVPGQASYRMNSANAVYFDTEQQAIAAGYRKSLR